MKKSITCLLLICLFTGFSKGSELQLKLESNFLNFPVTYDEEDNTTIEILIDRKNKYYFNLYLTDHEPEFWVFLDVTAFKGKTAFTFTLLTSL